MSCTNVRVKRDEKNEWKYLPRERENGGLPRPTGPSGHISGGWLHLLTLARFASHVSHPAPTQLSAPSSKLVSALLIPTNPPSYRGLCMCRADAGALAKLTPLAMPKEYVDPIPRP
ncbi:hypothetical protein KQX54_021739 [Cotesia glomerata]|uniref:Uncharacterized protein n=1 Tax=Cotesia glomerata TaxID=32391 RepID=A0AAV7JA10_COTGL|nr:hypothetical protein KQX54_021739 [Cotesia glomerata]